MKNLFAENAPCGGCLYHTNKNKHTMNTLFAILFTLSLIVSSITVFATI